MGCAPGSPGNEFWPVTTNLRIIAVPGLVVEHVKKRFRPPLFDVVPGRRLWLAKHVTGMDQRGNVLSIAQGRDGRVSSVDRMQDRSFPVRVLVDDGEKYLRQMVTVRVSDVCSQDLVPAVAFKSGLKSGNIRG